MPFAPSPRCLSGHVGRLIPVRSTPVVAALLLAATLVGVKVASTIRSAAAQGVETVRLPGVVRDFKKSNTNFAVSPSAGNGHYAGNLSLSLTPEHRPVFTGGGFRVNTQWRNLYDKPIPPHLFANPVVGGLGVVECVTMPTIDNQPTIDTFHSVVGAYGGANTGPAPEWITNATMPAVELPSPLPPFTADVLYSGTGTSTLSTDLHCSTFTLQNNRILQISGSRIIVCTDTFKVENGTSITMQPGAMLIIYILKDCIFENNVSVNMGTWQPWRVTIINLGTTTMLCGENNTSICANVISPDAPLYIKNNSDFYGTFLGESVQIANNAGFHVDSSPTEAATVCDHALNDTAGAAGVSSSGGIPSTTAFQTWYADTLGENLSAVHTITLVKNSGVYEYLDSTFHPIDHQLFGNEGDDHNYYFTYAIEAQFVHDACNDSFFEFYGADDAWLFIDGNLAMDLGGVVPGTSQYVEIDRLPDLEDGKTYSLHFFYAQRQDLISSFNVRTNLNLISTPSSVPVSAGYD